MKTVLSAAFIALLGVAAVGPASAQSLDFGRDGVRVYPDRPDFRRPPPPPRYDNDDDGISRGEASRIARRNGVDDIDRIVETRDTFRVFGEDRRGNDIRVDIDKDDGDVISVRRR